jgi:hypothetical protein
MKARPAGFQGLCTRVENRPDTSHLKHGGHPVIGAYGSIAGGDSDDALLVDVANVPLAQLVKAQGDSPVLRSVKRLKASLEDPNGVLSAFSSYIEKP